MITELHVAHVSIGNWRLSVMVYVVCVFLYFSMNLLFLFSGLSTIICLSIKYTVFFLYGYAVYKINASKND